MIEIYKNTKIFVACPANAATGGPELLHQLAYHLRKDLSIDAYMYYYFDFVFEKLKSKMYNVLTNCNQKIEKFYSMNKNEYKAISTYQMYNVSYVFDIPLEDDNSKNILIVPEGLYGLSSFKNIKKGVWFLSVDNFYIWKYIVENKINLLLYKSINKIFKILFKKPLINFDITSEKILKMLVEKCDYTKDPLLKLSDFYLFQSHYAIDHFKNLEHKYYLSDYLNKDFLKIETDLSNKEDIVAFNPKKGFSFTKKIISSAKDIKFVPLINMSRREVIKTLQRAKVYIDFGNHPGKDRIPREAAILGCCVITGKRGSAAFFEDVSIPEEYKFEDREENIPKIIDKIKDCFENYEERYKDFEHYREVIKNEPQRFIEDLKKIFVKVEK
jgi:hypothetical protein